MSNNLDNLLHDIYSSDSQSQGVKELANLINNLSNLLLKAISQLETRVLKLEQQVNRMPGGGMQMSSQPLAPTSTPTPAPMPRSSSPFSAPTPQRSAPPPPPPQPTARAPAPVQSTGGGPSSAMEAASMLGATLKPAPKPATTSSTTSPSSGPSFLTGTVNTQTSTTNPSNIDASQPDAGFTSNADGAEPDASFGASSSSGIAGPGGGFRGELAEKLARRRQKVQQQLEDDFEAPDLSTEGEEMVQEVEEDEGESTSSELKSNLEDELKNAFSKLKG